MRYGSWLVRGESCMGRNGWRVSVKRSEVTGEEWELDGEVIEVAAGW